MEENVSKLSIIQQIYYQYFEFIQTNKCKPTALELGSVTKHEFFVELSPAMMACMAIKGDNKYMGLEIVIVEEEQHIKVR